MQNSRLVGLLKVLTEKELNHFELFIQSSYHNQHPLACSLFKQLKKAAPDYTATSIDKAKLCRRLKSQPSSLGKAATQLVRLFGEFLSLERLKTQHGFYKRHLCLQELLKRNLPNYFESFYKQTLQKHEQEKREHAGYYYEAYLLSADYLQFLLRQKTRKPEASVAEVLRHFDTFYILQKLKLSAALLNEQYIVQSDYHSSLLDEVVKAAQSPEFKENLALQVYYNIFQMLQKEVDEQPFQNLKQLIAEQPIKALPKADLEEIYTYLINYCVFKMKEGQLPYYKELFELYKRFVAQGLAYVDGYISIAHVKNIVAMAAKHEDFDWAIQFIEDHKADIEPRLRDSVYNYNMGILYFYKKDYNQAITYLREVSGIDVYYFASTKTCLLKIYYEQQEDYAFYNLVDSFKIYIRQNKVLSNSSKAQYQNFVKFLAKLFKYRAGDSHQSLEQLDQELKETTAIDSMRWLTEKVEMLK